MRLVVIASAVSLLAPVAFATPVIWEVGEGGNGHAYELVDAPNLAWTDARDAAAALAFRGVNGHLVVITSAGEQQFIADTFSPGNDVGERWLGGFQDTDAPDFSEPSGGWRWITGESWNFTAWHAGEPNNSGPNHDYLKTWGTGPAEWEDFRLDGGDVRGFVVEYAVPPCIGDVTGDDRTDVTDFGVFAAFFGQTVAPYTNGDLDGSGVVDVLDFGLFAADFGCGTE